MPVAHDSDITTVNMLVFPSFLFMYMKLKDDLPFKNSYVIYLISPSDVGNAGLRPAFSHGYLVLPVQPTGAPFSQQGIDCLLSHTTRFSKLFNLPASQSVI